MVKVAVIGEVYANNIGDGVICRCAAAMLAEYLPEDCQVQLIDLSGRNATRRPVRQNKLQKAFWLFRGKVLSNRLVKKVLSPWIPSETYGFWQFRFRERQVIRRICEANPVDAVVFAGGELFKDYFAYKIQFFIRYYQVPTFFNACGVDSVNNAFITKILKKSISADPVKRVTTRNQKDTCKALISPEQYVFCPDPAIMAADVFPQDLPSRKKYEIGLGIMCIDEIEEKREQLLNFWKDIVDLLREQGKEFRLFVNGAAEDYRFAKEVLSFLRLPEEYLLPQPSTPEELTGQIASFERVCAFRMHSAIIAYAYGIPFVGFGWDRKIPDFAKVIEKVDLIFDWETAVPEEILQRLENCSFDADVYERLKNRIRSEFKEVADQICLNT